MTTWEFPASDPIILEATLPSGGITVIAGPVTTATVSLTPSRSGKRGEELIANTTVEFDAGRLTVTVPDRLRLLSSTSLDLTVHLPSGSSCQLKTASADIRCTGEIGSLDARTASGDITADQVTGSASINTASGDVRLDAAAATVQVNTASGDTEIGRAGDEVTVNSASGETCASAARTASPWPAARAATSRSTPSRQAAARSTPCPATSASPSRAYIGVYLDLSALSGDVRSDLEPAGSDGDAALSLKCRSVSGDVRVTRAAGR